ncbi:Cytoplasmic phosphatidylinositol transfer protein 1 [Geodia barretti]|nr:Cytoplasmic phosphatidylinositol transfer protein 1 [Geodia barretti]
MCSYKAVKVFFEVWGMQTKVESAVHKAILDIIIKGHKQAFLWMDEWYGMTIDDVRNLNRNCMKRPTTKYWKDWKYQNHQNPQT